MKHKDDVGVYIDDKRQAFLIFRNNSPFEGWSSIAAIPFNHPKARKALREYRKQKRLLYIDIDDNNWLCLCGNTSTKEGFFPCNRVGAYVEGTPVDWNVDWYVCDKCGRTIDMHTGQITGYRQQNSLTSEERAIIDKSIKPHK